MNGSPLNWTLAGGRVLALTDVGGAELRCMGPEKQQWRAQRDRWELCSVRGMAVSAAGYK